MPKLGPSTDEGTVVRWHKSEGDDVREGEAMLDVETEKAVQEVLAESDGVLHKVVVPEGTTCPVGTLLALLRAVGETPVSPEPASVPSAPPVAVMGTSHPEVPPRAQEHDDRLGRMLVKASPAARRVARERGIKLSAVTGTGPRGRIVSADVERAATAAEVLGHAARRDVVLPPETMHSACATAAPGAAGVVREQRPLSSVRRLIGQRMLESKRISPHFYLSMDVDMVRVKEIREAWKAAGEAGVPSYNDFMVWACARALRACPELNSSVSGNDAVFYSDVNIGIAVDAPDGLVVPVIRHADRLSVRGVASRAGELAARAREKKLTPSDGEGGTFTVSNLGMLGVDRFVAIINPPQAAILAAGRVAPRVVTDGTSISIRVQATLTLSADHRVVDGALAGRFLAMVKEVLEKADGH